MDAIQLPDDWVWPFSEVLTSFRGNPLTDTRDPRHSWAREPPLECRGLLFSVLGTFGALQKAKWE